jgi:hypothetical protein
VLTICLLTQGREQIDEFIESARSLEDLSYVNFLIVDNASPMEQSQKIKSWASRQPRTYYIRRDNNSTDMNQLWEEVKEFASEWVLFPGDDDRLLESGFLEWKSITDVDSSINVIAMSAEIIDKNGKPVHEIQNPNFSEKYSVGSSLARALHHPPFFWPSLFFKKELVTHTIPVSRFVVDWTTGIYLVTKGKIVTSETPAIQYRRHSTQESNLVSTNRKHFEALYWLDEFIGSKDFDLWLTNAEDVQIQDFWREVINTKPIYDQEDLSMILTFSIAKKILHTEVSSHIRNVIVADLSLILGALQYDNDFRESVDGLKNEKEVFGNIRIKESQFNCSILDTLLPYFRGSDNAKVVSLACSHSKQSAGSILVDCNKYVGLPLRQSLDLLLRDISEDLEDSGALDFRVTPTERKVIEIFRSLKGAIPHRILRKLRNRL